MLRIQLQCLAPLGEHFLSTWHFLDVFVDQICNAVEVGALQDEAAVMLAHLPKLRRAYQVKIVAHSLLYALQLSL